MKWDLPITIEIGDIEYDIREKCDYRVVLDAIDALNDDDLDERSRLQCALFIFYEDLSGCPEIEIAVEEMMRVINCGETIDKNESEKPKLMDWNHDFKNIAPPISKVLGYSVRDAKNYTHWYDFIGAYGEIGDCYWSQVINIRQKRLKGKPLDENDRVFYREHKKDIDLPLQLSNSEQEWLDDEW